MTYIKVYLLLYLLVSVISQTIKVGLYNSIPDLADDKFASYKSLVTSKWSLIDPDVKLELDAGKTYNPYGDLNKYLGDGKESFDLIETDMAQASQLIDKVVEMNKNDMKNIIDFENYLNASIDSVKHNETFIGIPTLACGNFIQQIQIGGSNFRKFQKTNYTLFVASLKIAKEDLVSNQPCGHPRDPSKFIRLLGGKIDDREGWYLPYIYLDAYGDYYGPKEIERGIREVLHGKPDNVVVKRLRTFLDYFRDNCGNLSQKNIIENVVAGNTGNFFGFSEKLSVILKESNYSDIVARNVLTPPIGVHIAPLLYTDAIVINKKKFEKADKQKRNAIMKFIKFFTSDTFRRDFVMGEDLKPNRVRYLLVPNKKFYKETNNSIYKEYYQIIQHGVNAPSLNKDQREKMERVLKDPIFSSGSGKICVQLMMLLMSLCTYGFMLSKTA